MSFGRIVIIGGGECGVRAALTARDEGHGGPITIVGKERHLPYERPPLSKDVLNADETPALKVIASAGQLHDGAITFVAATTATAIDPAAHIVSLTNGDLVPYDKLLIATGSQPRTLPAVPAPHERIAVLRTFDDALRIRGFLGPGRHVAIVGGGFIGLEVAAAARHHGTQATVIETLPRVLSRVVPEEIATAVAARHRAEGVAIHCSVAIADIEAGETTVTVRLADGRLVVADFLVIGIGADPVVDIAEAAGLAVDGGILVDDRLRTSASDIYAAGDCCAFPLPFYADRRVRLECWRNALDQGSLAARNMLGADEAVSSLPWFWSDQYDLTLQMAGLPDAGSTTVRRDLGNDAFLLFHLDLDGRLVAASGIGKGTSIARDMRIAEMLVARQSKLDAGVLSAPSTRLKSLLAA